MKAFVAVPKVTSPETIKTMRRLARQAGFEAVFAADVEPKNPKGTPADKIVAQFNAVRDAMRHSDVLIANVTPFLGAEPDPDVSFQLGYIAAQQKPVFSYSNITPPFYDRVRDWNGVEFGDTIETAASGHQFTLKHDRDLMRIEDMGIKDRTVVLDNPGADNYNNLMLEGPSMKTGSLVLTPQAVGVSVAPDQIYTNTEVFNASLAHARQSVLVEGKTKAIPAPPYNENPKGAYLAGPDVFLPNLTEHFAAKKQLTAAAGIDGVAPVDSQMDFGLMQTWELKNGNNPRMREAIYDADAGVMQSVRVGLFNLTPFHGATADSGTIFEVGYMVGKDDALGRNPMVFGYSNTPGNLAERISEWNANPQGSNYGGHQAQDVYKDAVYSPMIDGAILVSGGSLDQRLAHDKSAMLKEDALFSALDMFPPVVMEAEKMLKLEGLNARKTGRKIAS